MNRMKREVYENPDELIAFLQDLKKERESKRSYIFSPDAIIRTFIGSHCDTSLSCLMPVTCPTGQLNS